MKKPKIDYKKKMGEGFKKLDRFSKICMILFFLFSISAFVFTLLLFLPNPLPIDRVETGYASDVYVSDGYAYVADSYYGMLIIDVSDPKNPGEVKYIYTYPFVQSIYLSNDTAYLAAPDRGLVVINVSDPENPGNPIYIDTPGSETDVYIEGDIAYIASEIYGLTTVNISDPLNPDITPWHYLYGNTYGVQISGEMAFMAGGFPYEPSCSSIISLKIVNISDLENIHTEENVCIKGYAIDVFLYENFAYMALYDEGLGIINITDPLNPGNPIYVDTIGTPFKVHVSGGIAFVADYDEGLSIINVSNPLNPGSHVVINTIGSTLSVFVDDGYAYVADGENGLLIIDISNIFNEVNAHNTNFSIILICITISASAGIISEILFLISKNKLTKKRHELFATSQIYDSKKPSLEKSSLVGASIGLSFGIFIGLIHGVSAIITRVIKYDFGFEVLQLMFFEMLVIGVLGVIIGASIAGEFLLMLSGVTIGVFFGIISGILIGDALGGYFASVNGMGIGITSGMILGAIFAIFLRIILRKWEEVKRSRKIIDDLINLIQNLDGLSKSAYEEMKFSDFALSRIISITEIIKALHKLSFKIEISDASSIEETIEKLKEKEIVVVKIGDFSYWEQIRKEILHDHVKVGKEQADQLEKVYNMVINNLDSFISTNKKQLHLKIDVEI